MPIGKIAPPQLELNWNVVWNQMSNDVKGAFIGVPQKVKLETGFMLYKATEFGLANRAGKITEWWSPLDSYGMDPGLAARINLAKHLGANPSDLIRVMAAVKEDWNALTNLLKAQLLKPVYAFWGQCAMQKRLDNPQKLRPGIKPGSTKNLPGYAWQFYIPNLTTQHICQTSLERLL